MAGESAPVPVRPVLALPGWARAAALLAAWLPFAWVVLFHVPRFDPIFGRLEAAGRLPDLTRACLWLSRASADYAGLPLVGGLAALVALDGLAGRRARRAGRAGWYWYWFAALVVLGAVATFTVVVGLVAPVGRMGSSVR